MRHLERFGCDCFGETDLNLALTILVYLCQRIDEKLHFLSECLMIVQEIHSQIEFMTTLEPMVQVFLLPLFKSIQLRTNWIIHRDFYFKVSTEYSMAD